MIGYGNDIRQLDMGHGFPRTASGLMGPVNPSVRASRGVDRQLEVVPVDPHLT